MPASRYPLIAREGWPMILALAVLAALVFQFVGAIASVPLWVVVVVAVYIFRDPEREIPPSPLAVISPVDGQVVEVKETHDPYLDRRAVRISIQMPPYGVFSARSPVEGKILQPAGGGAAPVDEEGRHLPHGVWLQTDEGDDLVLAMDRGPLHNAPRCYVRFGERVGQGQRCGFVHLGARVNLYVPQHTRIDVKQDQRVTGGSDVIATFVHK